MFLNNLPLYIAMIRNIRSQGINRTMIGHRITMRIGPITRSDIFSYADATLDKRARYGSSSCTVPPFYLARLLYPMFRYFLVNRDLGLNLLKLVHGQQTIEWSGEAREGDIIDAEMSVSDITDSPAGEMISLRTVARVKDRTIGEATTVFIIRRRNSRKRQRQGGPEHPAELFRRKISTDRGQPLLYARVSGDTNFIHTNRLLARLAGLPGTIMHGVCVAAMTANCLLDEVLDGDMSRMKGISLRFAGPVIPGEEITVIGYPTAENGLIAFKAVNSSGKPVLKNGEYRFIPADENIKGGI